MHRKILAIMSHRLSFIKVLEPSLFTVDSLNFSPCGRFVGCACQNGIVEIYEVESRLHLASLSEPELDARIRTIIWLKKSGLCLRGGLSSYRLITVGLHGMITDWDLRTCSIIGSSNSYGGAIFSALLGSDDRLIVACDDGSFRSFNTSSQEDPTIPSLHFDRAFRCHTSSLLSICQLPDDLYACGTADSAIIIHNVTANGVSHKLRLPSVRSKNVRNLTAVATKVEEVDADCDEAHKHEGAHSNAEVCCQVWSLLYITKHKMLASGDSFGNVILWDVNTRTMIKLFALHVGEVMSLGLGLDGDSLLSAGVDGKVTLLLHNNKLQDNVPGETSGWYLSGVKYQHRGDISCMAMHPLDDRLATSGTDMIVTIFRGVKSFCNKNAKPQLILLGVPSWISRPVSLSDDKTITLCKYQRHVDIWHLPKDSKVGGSGSNVFCNDVSHKLRKLEGGEAQGVTQPAHDHVSNLNASIHQNAKLPNATPNAEPLPYKAAQIRVNELGGHIKSAALSPSGRLVVLNKATTLNIFQMEMIAPSISQLPLDLPEAVYYTLIFLSEYVILVSAFMDSKFQLVTIDVKTGKINQHKESSRPLEFEEPIIRMVKLGHQLGIDHRDTDGDLIVAFGIESDAYIVNVSTGSINRLPRFPSNTPIVAVAYCVCMRFLTVFSTRYQYYFYDLKTGEMIMYNGEYIHTIPSKVINQKAHIYNAIWFANSQINRILVQTTNAVFSISIDLGLVNATKCRDEERGYHRVPSEIFRCLKERRYIHIGPRKFSSVPSTKTCLYQPPALHRYCMAKLKEITSALKSEDATRNTRNEIIKHTKCLYKLKFLVHLEIEVIKDSAHMMAFYISPPKDSIFQRKRYGR